MTVESTTQTTAQTDHLIRDAAAVTDDWLGAVLGVEGLEVASVERIGTGQMSQSHRVRWTAPTGAGSVVVKLASDDEASRTTGVGMGAYYREVAFYQNLADRLGDAVPACHLAVYDEADGAFTLVLADVVDGVPGDQIAGCTPEEARRAIATLAAAHAPVLNDLATGITPWLNLPNPLTGELYAMLLPGFLDRYGDRVPAECADVLRAIAPSLDAWYADRRPPLGLVHGDFRLDNLLFTGGEDDASGGGCTVVDWQTVTWGPALLDLAYFLGGALSVEDRRAHERDLVAGYQAGLVAHGATSVTVEECWEEYRRQVFLGVVMVVIPAMVVQQTERGDEMFMTLLRRVCAQVADLDSLSLLPDPEAPTPALRPTEDDEAVHEPGHEATWNESFYFDVVADDGSLGAYVRLGRLPNQDVAVYTAAVVRPGAPSVLVVDDRAPLPPSDDPRQRVATDRFDATQECVRPLEEFRVRLAGTGTAYDDPAAPLRAGTGPDVAVELDLTWTTDGVPYQWRSTTRYEIPCRVTGTIRVGDETFTVAGAGQRDHSRGARDWWANDWSWSAFHLDDGTRTHQVSVPDLPGLAVGYHQREGDVVELASGSVTAVDGPDDLPVSAVVDGGDVGALDVEPLAWGALRMVSPDGRVAHFPRAMARVTTSDGRTGLGWIEWNRVQP